MILIATHFCSKQNGTSSAHPRSFLDLGYNTIKHCDKTAKTVLAVLSQLF